MTALDIRWSTDLVTFFNPPHWGLPENTPFAEWDDAMSADPRPYFERMLDEARDAGLDGIELAPAPGGWENALVAFGSASAFRAELDRRGLLVSSSYALPTWLAAILDASPEDRAAREREADELWARHADFAVEIGCRTVVTSTVPRASFSEREGVNADADAFERPADDELLQQIAAQLNRIGEIVARRGLALAIHTDAYSVCSRVEDVDRLMALTDPTNVLLCIDAGHIALDGADPIEVLRRHHDRAPVLHWKDCSAHLEPHVLSGPPMVRHDEMIRWFRLIGEGTIDWHEWTSVLRAAGWSGWGVAELDMSPDPVREIRQALDFYRTELVGS